MQPTSSHGLWVQWPREREGRVGEHTQINGFYHYRAQAKFVAISKIMRFIFIFYVYFELDSHLFQPNFRSSSSCDFDR